MTTHTTTPPPRKPIQIAVAPPFPPFEHPTIYALCDDGTIWSYLDRGGEIWWLLPDLSAAH
jgi:hypothetical protein